MTNQTILRLSLSVGTVLFSLAGLVQAQQPSAAVGKPFIQSAPLGDSAKKTLDFTVRVLGSVTGRVFSDAEDAGPDQGISGVKISLRSRDAGFRHWVIEQFTDETGAYSFEDLRPGKYWIEVDAGNLPIRLKTSDVIDEPIKADPSETATITGPDAVRRELSGVVFVDKNGNNRYDPRKDTVVPGATIAVGDRMAISGANGAYRLENVPEGRLAVQVTWPHKAEKTHVVLDLGSPAVLDRVVDIPTGR